MCRFCTECKSDTPNIEIAKVSIENCDKLESLDLTNFNKLTDVTLRKLPKLKSVKFPNILIYLFIANCPAVESINLSDYNSLEYVTIYYNSNIKEIICPTVDSLDISECPLLSSLHFSDINCMSIRHCKSLTLLDFSEKKMTYLDYTGNVSLKDIKVNDSVESFIYKKGL